ncbi:MAG: hypothetical protein ACYDH6_16120 [Acidimicrobiales bacterium]
MRVGDHPKSSHRSDSQRRPRGYPSGRTLHLVDLNNLLGVGCSPPRVEHQRVAEALAYYKAAAPVCWGDHTIIRASPTLAVEAKLAWPGARVCVRRGRLADSALIAELAPEQISARYDRLVVGSGDASLVAVAAEQAARGIPVAVITGQRGGPAIAVAAAVEVW